MDVVVVCQQISTPSPVLFMIRPLRTGYTKRGSTRPPILLTARRRTVAFYASTIGGSGAGPYRRGPHTGQGQMIILPCYSSSPRIMGNMKKDGSAVGKKQENVFLQKMKSVHGGNAKANVTVSRTGCISECKVMLLVHKI